MQVTKLRVHQFRNIADQEINFPSRLTLIIGENGQGKTNLLEALYLLSQARSFRGVKPRELVRWEDDSAILALSRGQHLQPIAGDGALVTGLVSSLDGEKEITFRVEDGQARIFVNGNRVTAANLFYGQARMILFVPEDLQLIKGAPQLRRQFVDRVLAMVDRGFVETSVSYERAVKNRNEVLRRHLSRSKRSGSGRTKSVETGSSRAESPEAHRSIEDKLRAWDEVLIEKGTLIAKRRAAFLRSIQAEFLALYRYLSGARDEQVQLSYLGKFFERSVPSEQVLDKQRLLELYQVGRMKDFRFASTTFGVHRDDVLIELDTGLGFRSARLSASQGQTRSLALALKLASARYLERETGEPPIVLLDDVESELDPFRRKALSELLLEMESQVVVTANQVGLEFEPHLKDIHVLSIRNGFVAES